MVTEKYKVQKFEECYTNEWNNFLKKSKNATFMHNTNYMHYHYDRFIDCSLMIIEDEEIVALLPGNIDNSVFYSHKGLTYGGLLIKNNTKLTEVLDYFKVINEYLFSKKNILKVVYKAIPYIYNEIPSQEDEYALFRLGATKIACGASSTIVINNKIDMSSLRKRSIKKAQRYPLEIYEDEKYEAFWRILNENLESRYGTNSVHTLDEIALLKTRFQNEIKLYTVFLAEECVAGALIYIVGRVAHVQYIASNEKGKKTSALDYLFNYLIEDVFFDMNYFDFGTSVEENGYKLNTGLVFQKEGFGARTTLYNQYEYNIEEVLK
ncbi:GNAT family N-acetyltransferase [Lysinibacillus sphaericus]|uniref:GNAT family N-acetyltransferase n=1 Tax=Lysinibacillus sphaericus TaxID=1421 RepID=UPI003D01EAF2